ncbi:prepilin peptidase [Yinghuangia seranimata]|uniref:prepilin peptidase n=1 Tax=Yinghuangia seranimata TaxID=408067 RepID=UPI00248C565E|nr:A24 family peptidase [Yinghuangia seranimata]MDI2132087.1 A24 family peptidase [Yinghuangia seranimata]
MFIGSPLVCAALGFAAGLVLRLPVERLVAAAPVPAPPAALVRTRPPGTLSLAGLTAAVFASLAWRLGPGLDLLAFLVLAACGVVLALVDLRTLRLPDAVTGAMLLAGLALLGMESLAVGDPTAYARALAGALLLAGYHLALAVFRCGALGLGDVKLAAVLGLHLSWLGWDNLFAGAFLSFAGAGLAAAVLLLTRRARLDTALPFGPWMLLGALGGVLYGDQLMSAYAGW